jgi:membrane fusion protein (multidrug efflux system)
MSESLAGRDRTVRRTSWRILLLWGVPSIALIAAALVWALGGRYVETDNAYLKSDVVTIYPEVEGTVQEVLVAENTSVQAGQLLLRIDRAALDLDVQRAAAQIDSLRGELAATLRQFEMRKGMLAVAEDQKNYTARELQRQRELLAAKLTSAAKYDAAEHDALQARAQIEVVHQAIEELKVRLGPALGGTIDAHPKMREARAALESAKLRLAHAEVYAPVAGRVAKVPQVGTLARRGVPLFSLVRAEDLWVEANLKETQVGVLRAGQPVVVRVDAFPDAQWLGHVDTLSPASGAEFAVLPAQNASGNWVKVVQRVPVRIRIDSGPKDMPLRVGMSASVQIDPRQGNRWSRMMSQR